MSNQPVTVGVLLELIEQLRATPNSPANAVAQVPPVAQLSPVVPKIKVEIPEFTSGLEKSVDEWIREFTVATRKLRWDDGYRVTNVDIYLKETALRWYNHKYRNKAPTSWEEFCADIRERFRPPNYEIQLHRRLADCRQSRNEPVETFAFRLQELCDLVNTEMEKELRIKYFLAGLNGYLFERVFPHKPTEWDDAVNTACLYEVSRQGNEQTMATNNSARNNYKSSYIPVKSEYRERTQNNKELNSPRTTTNRPICWKCDKPGHVAKFCRARNPENRPDDQQKQYTIKKEPIQVSSVSLLPDADEEKPADHPKGVLPNLRG